MVIAIGDLLDVPGDLLMDAFGLGVVCGAHPLQVAKTQDPQIFMLGMQALEFFVLQAGRVWEAHLEPPGYRAEKNFKIDIRQSSLSRKEVNR